MNRPSRLFAILVLAASTGAAAAESLSPSTWVVLPRVGDYRRAALHVDPVEAAVATGAWKPPRAGDAVDRWRGDAAIWRTDDGQTDGLVGGYAYGEFDAPEDGVALLEAPGCAAVCVNGQWLPGDPYGSRWFRLPVPLRAGANTVLAHLANPRARPRFTEPAAAIAWLPDRATAPNLLASGGGLKRISLSVPLRNASAEPINGASIRATWPQQEPITLPLRWIDPLLVTPITLTLPAPDRELSAGEVVPLRLEAIAAEGDEPLAAVDIGLTVVALDAPRTETLVSRIDGSVQAYAVALPAGEDDIPLLMLLHDAGQTARQAIDEVGPVEGCALVAPGGRGRFGFDWEDWSADDARETLRHVLRGRSGLGKRIDADRVGVAGVGMGGHGALRVATLWPDRFRLVGVADAWLSHFSQGSARVTPRDADRLARALARPASARDPMRTLTNLNGAKVMVSHAGAARAPLAEGRFLRTRLGEFHPDFAYSETEDAQSLAERVGEWAAALSAIEIPDPQDPPATIEFATHDLNRAGTADWVTIVAADQPGEIARVELRPDVDAGEVRGTTTNVARMRLNLAQFASDPEGELASTVAVTLDGSPALLFRPGRQGEILDLERDGRGPWRRTVIRRSLPPPHAGGLKSCFRSNPLLVYGDGGTEEERLWAAAKARYDAHVFWLRGAGRLDVMPAGVFAQRLAQRDRTLAGRSLILYGNARTNSFLAATGRGDAGLAVQPGLITIGDRPERGDDLAVIAVRPRPLDRRAGLAVIGGAGPVGMRLTTRLRYFWSGVAYPDVMLFGPGALSPTSDAAPTDDVRAAGFYSQDWSAESEHLLWRDLAL